jgi:hypothetical protein
MEWIPSYLAGRSFALSTASQQSFRPDSPQVNVIVENYRKGSSLMR